MAKLEKISQGEFIRMLHLHKDFLRSFLNSSSQTKGKRLVLRRAFIENASLRETNLQYIWLSDCTIKNLTLVKCDLNGAMIFDSELLGCSFIECSLIKAELNGSVFIDANFSKSAMTKAELFGTKLIGANLNDCDLRAARLFDTDMRGAILDGCQFDQAKFVRTKLFTPHRSNIMPFEPGWVEDVDISEEGDGSKIISTKEELVRYLTQAG